MKYKFLFILFFVYSFPKISSQVNREEVKLKSSNAAFSSNLPIVLIYTGSAKIVDEPKITATMKIVYNGAGKRNNYTDTNYDYNGKIGIELRGNSTQGFEKKPYSVETRDDAGNNLNVGILGMPAENDWVFRASYLDRSFIRNTLAHHLSAKTGRWSSKFRYCELFLNDGYQGIYIILEKIKKDKNRLDIATLNPDETDQENITGGYIYEISGFYNDFGESRRIKYPKLENINTLQLNYIRDYDDNFRGYMNNPDWGIRNTVYNEWIDVNSFIDEMIVQEAMRNSDAYGWSGYFHKDKNGPLKAGPVWDFDQAGGNSTYNEGHETTGWVFETHAFPNPEFWPQLFEDEVYRYLMRLRWEIFRWGPFSDNKVSYFIDSIAGLLGEAQYRNFDQWKILGKMMWRDTPGWEFRQSFDDHVYYLKSYMLQRMQWIDEQMENVPVPVDFPQKSEFSDGIRFNVYPNPVKDFLYVFFETDKPGLYKISLTDISGREMHSFTAENTGSENISALNMQPYPAGIYFVRLYSGHANIKTVKVLKPGY